MLRDEEIDEIVRETEFNRNQIVRLYSRFLSLDKKVRTVFLLCALCSLI